MTSLRYAELEVHPELSDSARQIYKDLYDYCEENGFPPSLAELAQITEYSKERVRQAFMELEKEELVERSKGVTRGTVPTKFIEKLQS